MMDEEIRQALSEVQEMKKMCGNINMKLTNIVTQRGQNWKEKLEAEYQRGLEDGKKEAESGEAIELAKADAFNKGMLFKEEKIHDAFLRGVEKGKAVSDKGCEGCKYEGNPNDNPCKCCVNGYPNQWTAKKRDDKIEVGDEVTHKSDSVKWTAIVTRISCGTLTLMEHSGAIADNYPIEDFVKTGRHFNIQSILEAMKND